MPLRSTIIGAASGVALLAGFVGFAVGLPEVVSEEPDAYAEDSGAQADDATPVAELLPETLLDGAMVRHTDVASEYAALFEKIEVFGTEQLTDAFGADTAVGVYTFSQEQVNVAVTIYDGESGLFLQTGPPVPRDLAPNQATVGEYIRQGDNVCFGQWQTQAYEQGAPPFQVQCQRVAGGRTVNVYAAPGLTVEQASDIADDVAEQAGLE